MNKGHQPKGSTTRPAPPSRGSAAIEPKHFVIPAGLPVIVKRPPQFSDKFYVCGIEIPEKPKC